MPVFLGFPGGSDGETRQKGRSSEFDLWVGKIPWRWELPLQYSCLENFVDRGTWWAAVHGVTQSQT